MISVDQALLEITSLFRSLDVEHVTLSEAGGRVLAQMLSAKRNQPPFASSAMDGYAVRRVDLGAGNILDVVGEAAAGGRFHGEVQPNQAIRIFTGAPVPKGADHILIQEDCTRTGDQITISPQFEQASYIRAEGSDFKIGTTMDSPVKLGASEISLLASMNHPTVPVFRKPVIALIATGDELVSPGQSPSDDQIISSNNYGLKALVEQSGGIARILPIAADNAASVSMVLGMAKDADCIVTLGGASVGDHDLLGQMAQSGEIETNFYKVAMRPGKPLMAGRYQGTPIIGLPGNPVSSLVCGHIFLRPALAKMQGLAADPLQRETVILRKDQPQNGPREHYMRAHMALENGTMTVFPADRQDSSLLSVMTKSNCLIVRPSNDPARSAGDPVQIIRL